MGCLEKSAKGLDEFVGRLVKAEAMKTAQDASTKIFAKQITGWLLAAIDRLDTAR